MSESWLSFTIETLRSFRFISTSNEPQMFQISRTTLIQYEAARSSYRPHLRLHLCWLSVLIQLSLSCCRQPLVFECCVKPSLDVGCDGHSLPPAHTSSGRCPCRLCSRLLGMAATLPPLPLRPLPPLLAIKHNAYDTRAWEQLLEQANSQPIEQSRPLYERFLSIFPLASRYWRQYILHEQAAHNYQQVEVLFSRCLLSTLSLSLFQCYLDYVKHVKTGADDYHDALTAAYEFTLQHVSLDLHSHSVWLDYLSFLGTAVVGSPYEETQKLHKQRAAFQRAVLLPSVGVEEVWREWEQVRA